MFDSRRLNSANDELRGLNDQRLQRKERDTSSQARTHSSIGALNCAQMQAVIGKEDGGAPRSR